MREYEPPHAELIPLFGPGRSSGNILWTYAVVLGDVFCGAMEVEVHPTSRDVRCIRDIPQELCSGLLRGRARERGIKLEL